MTLNTQLSSFNMDQSQKLFDFNGSLATMPPDKLQSAGKTMVDRLLKVRRSLSTEEQLIGLPRLNLLIEELRSLTRATPTQREEMVLYAVERQGATTATEIAEDTRLHPLMVKEILDSLYKKNLLYKVKKTVIGSGRQNYAIKSHRVKLPEAD